MRNIDRRSAALAALLSGIAMAGAGRAQPAPKPAAEPGDAHPASDWRQSQDIAMLVYPRMTALDLIGPQYMFASLMGARVHLVGKTMKPVTSDTGVTISPTKTFDDCPRDLAVVFAPGGSDGTLAAMRDRATLDFIADRGARATYVTSVCTGSLVLGAAGLLEGYKATSHWMARDSLAEFGAIPTDERVVRDRNRITGAGVTAGLDFGLQMIAEMRDPLYAQGVQLICEYDPDPPFNAGSVHTAPDAVKQRVARLFSGFPRQVEAIARSLKS